MFQKRYNCPELLIVFLIVEGIVAQSCWWSFCQSQARVRRDRCQPEHLYYETASLPCYGGVMYQCCSVPKYGNSNTVSTDLSGTDTNPNSIETSAKESGICSWYGSSDVPQGALTASGQRFNRHDMTAAHKTLPFGTRIRVRNLKNQKTVDVVINDRGPFMPRRILDLSFSAFGAVENRDKGLFHCSYTVLS